MIIAPFGTYRRKNSACLTGGLKKCGDRGMGGKVWFVDYTQENGKMCKFGALALARSESYTWGSLQVGCG